MKKYRQEQIKFRVWDYTQNSFYESDENYFIAFNGTLVTVDFDGCIVYPNDYEVQLFTGYLDKNKKEIYEGDIVKYANGNVVNDLFFRDGQKEYDAAEIRYLKGGFHLCQKYLGRTPLEDFLTCSCCPCSLEIIGNVLETPEQLNNTQITDSYWENRQLNLQNII